MEKGKFSTLSEHISPAKINLMPIYQEVHDDQGIFEKYSYILLLVNPSIDEKVFSWE